MNLLNKWNAEKIPMAKHHVDLTQLIVINAEASVLCVMGFVDKKNDKIIDTYSQINSLFENGKCKNI